MTTETPSGQEISVMLEILLLLRSIAGMEKMTMVKRELMRLGYTAWSAEETQHG